MQFFFRLLILTSINFSAFAIQLTFPVDCKLGENCWISNLPRHFYQNKQVDFRCGSKTYPDHKGTDFALKDYKQMNQGVNVLVPFDGEVRATRDGMRDISVKDIGKDAIKGSECGNAVVIKNGEYEAQLCHLKKGSILVKQGQYVKAGDVVGMIGLSGMTEYPHLHISVRKNSKEIDPFYGDLPDCGLKPQSLWKDADKLDLHAKTGVVYNYGFAFNSPTPSQVRSGEYIKKQPDRPSSFIGFVDIFSVDKGDKIVLSIENNERQIIAKKEHKFDKYQARYFFFIGKVLRGKKIFGKYKLNITYYHAKGGVENFSKNIAL